MDQGRVVEFDHPYKLLQDSSSVFSQMVLQMGEAHATRLKHLAAETYSDEGREWPDESNLESSRDGGITNKGFESPD